MTETMTRSVCRAEKRASRRTITSCIDGTGEVDERTITGCITKKFHRTGDNLDSWIMEQVNQIYSKRAG
jgi:hypothetical protein